MNTSEAHLNKYIAFLEKELAECENTKGELGNAKNYIEDFIDERLKIREAISKVVSYNLDFTLSENIINFINYYEDVKHGKDCEYKYNKIKDEKSLADYKLRLIHNFLPYCVPEDNTIQKADSFLNTIKGYLNHNAPITSGDLNMEEKVRNFLYYSYENYDSLSNLEVNIENLIIDYKSLQGLTTQIRELLKDDE